MSSNVTEWALLNAMEALFSEWTLCLTIVLTVLSIGAALLIRRTLSISSGRSLAVLLPASAVIAVTVSPGGGYSTRSWRSSVLLCIRYGPEDLTDLWSGLGRIEPMMNVALFVPLGFLALLSTGRPLITLLGGVSLSLVIELTQAALGTRACTHQDLVANIMGMIVGVLAAMIIRLAATRSGGVRAADQSSPSMTVGSRPR